MAAETSLRTADKTIEDGDLRIATQAFGDRSDPPVLLIMGAMASMLWWPDAFCHRLAARGRHVIRYDNRDTGLSTKYEPGSATYTKDDMARDAVRVLDAYGIAAAHVAGMSLGGMIAQIMASQTPERVASLTLISTTPLNLDGRLPPSTEDYMRHSAKGETIDWTDRGQVIDFVAQDVRMIAGTSHPHDAQAARAFIERDYDRSGGYLSATNHFMLTGGDAVNVSSLKPPLLVIHGTADPLYPIEHGRALAKAAKAERFIELDGGGHEMHEAHWGEIIDAIVKHPAE
ncbi:MAG: alpha/beta fold hydrolase [Rhizobiaceae bacterium]|nr:alpha/beta fold hydrolase [Rhizobiaceae bacterium]MCV0405625.1 alpha/beta fold hydrolase [Rhizobiaceae bacterium]